MTDRWATYAGTEADTPITATFRRSEWVMVGVALLGQTKTLDGKRFEEYQVMHARVRDLLVADSVGRAVAVDDKEGEVKTRDSAIEWIEANINCIVRDTGGSIGKTNAHRYAVHIFEGLAHGYAKQIAEEAASVWRRPVDDGR